MVGQGMKMLRSEESCRRHATLGRGLAKLIGPCDQCATMLAFVGGPNNLSRQVPVRAEALILNRDKHAPAAGHILRTTAYELALQHTSLRYNISVCLVNDQVMSVFF